MSQPTTVGNYIDVFSLPLVQQILTNAEQQILLHTGIEVQLQGCLKGFTGVQDAKKIQLQHLLTSSYQVTMQQILTKKRVRKIVLARQVYMYCLRMYFNETLRSIGQQFGADHTTAIHSVNAVKNLLFTNDPESPKINTIIQSLLKPI